MDSALSIALNKGSQFLQGVSLPQLFPSGMTWNHKSYRLYFLVILERKMDYTVQQGLVISL